MQATSSKALPPGAAPRGIGVPPLPPSRRGASRGAGAFAPLEPIGARARVLLGLGFFVVFVLVWALATLGGFVPPTCCSPSTTSSATSA
jgi:NitT/TauT family transport system permease protein